MSNDAGSKVEPAPEATASHLFVVHGMIGKVIHDAVIVPTDEVVEIEDQWNSVIGSAPVPGHRDFTAGWARCEQSQVWLVDVASGAFTDVIKRLRLALDDIEAAKPWRDSAAAGPVGGRPLPLVVLPVLGIGSGGRGEEKGEVLRQLVGELQTATHEYSFDLALVTPDPAVYAAAQYTRRPAQAEVRVNGETNHLFDKAKGLATKAINGELALFLGAGVSIPAGLPAWKELIAELAKDLSAEDQKALNSLDVTDRAQLIEQSAPTGFQQRVAEITKRATTPSLVHALLAGLDVAQVVTTNYDTLFEVASKAAGHKVDVVLPHQSAVGQRRWVLKMHGDVGKSDKIVLTRRHMVMYDAANRPSAALLQSLLLTKHLVVIGASMTDPNIIRLAHEVDAYRTEHGQAPRHIYGTVLDAGPPSPLQARLWKDQLDWVDMTGMGVGSGPRALEILLDLVGMFASSKSSWLLDPRFEGLLDEEHRDFARTVRKLVRDHQQTLRSDTWQPLGAAFNALGIDSE